MIKHGHGQAVIFWFLNLNTLFEMFIQMFINTLMGWTANHYLQGETWFQNALNPNL